MSATVGQIAALANVPKFLEERGHGSTYGLCHEALTWLAIQIKKTGIPTYNVHLCNGVFAGQDHSWVQVENTSEETQTIVDMTVDQFGEFPVPYVGPVSPGYVLHKAVLLSDESNIQEFIEGLG
jgi:hypothetical protein